MFENIKLGTIIACVVIIVLLVSVIIPCSEKKNFNREISELEFQVIPRESQKTRGQFVLQHANQFDIILTSSKSWYHGIIEYSTASVWTHVGLLYRKPKTVKSSSSLFKEQELYVVEIGDNNGYTRLDGRERHGLSIEPFEYWLNKLHPVDTQILLVSFSDFMKMQSPSKEIPIKQHYYNSYYSEICKRAESSFDAFVELYKNRTLNTGVEFITPVFKQKFKPVIDNNVRSHINCSEFVAFFLQQFRFIEKKYRPRCYSPGDLVYTNDYSKHLKVSYYVVQI